MNAFSCTRSDSGKTSLRLYVSKRRIGAAVPNADRMKIGSASGAEKQRSAPILSLVRSDATCRFSVVARMKLPRRNRCGEDRSSDASRWTSTTNYFALLSAPGARSIFHPQAKWPQQGIRARESIRNVRHRPIFFRGRRREPDPIAQSIPAALDHANAI